MRGSALALATIAAFACGTFTGRRNEHTVRLKKNNAETILVDGGHKGGRI